MKKILLTALLLFTLTMGMYGVVNAAEQKIATIDIQRVVSQSAKVQALNKEQEKKILELEKWIEVVKKEVDKQQTQEGKEKLLNKYRTTYEQKKNSIILDGQTKMQNIMNGISDTIAAQAKAKGYTMIITKAVVVYSEEDITDAVIKEINSKK